MDDSDKWDVGPEYLCERNVYLAMSGGISGVFRTELTLIVMKGMYRMTPVHISGQTSSL